MFSRYFFKIFLLHQNDSIHRAIVKSLLVNLRPKHDKSGENTEIPLTAFLTDLFNKGFRRPHFVLKNFLCDDRENAHYYQKGDTEPGVRATPLALHNPE